MYRVKTKIKAILEERELTQKELAKRAGMRESTVSEICRGAKTVINLKHFGAIARVLGIKDIRELIELEKAAKDKAKDKA